KFESEIRKPIPVHWKPDVNLYKIDKYGVRKPVNNQPIISFSPPAADKGLWGGEEVIKGYKTNRYIRIPYVWVPTISQRIYCSEILQKHLLIQCTQRTEDLIDKFFGFDHYILQTHEIDLKSRLGVSLKRSMLIKLITKQITEDKNLNEKIYQTYQHYLKINDINSVEEAEWFGLTLEEAYEKQISLEKQNPKNLPNPFKNIYKREILEKILNIQDSKEKYIASN
ncbi:unnamed protein product, partial [Gordionus sp. m RMFG-2023]